MGTAGVVRDHPSDRAKGTGGRVGGEMLAVSLERLVERPEHNTGLDPDPVLSGIDLQHPVHMAGEIGDHAGPESVARHAGARAARREGNSRLPANPKQKFDIPGVARPDDSARSDLVDARRVRIESQRFLFRGGLSCKGGPKREGEILHCAFPVG